MPLFSASLTVTGQGCLPEVIRRFPLSRFPLFLMTLLVTGSSGLIGSEVVHEFCQLGWQVHVPKKFQSPRLMPTTDRNTWPLLAQEFFSAALRLLVHSFAMA